MRISVVGLGYVGLPAAVAFHDAGYNVSGIDISEDVVAAICNGKSPISDPTEEIELPELSERWGVSKEFDQVGESKVVIITVPTPTDSNSEPDLSHVFSAFRSVFSKLNPDMGTIVILESTVSPGTTRRVTEMVADEFKLRTGKDFFVCYSPERVSPGDGKNVRNVSRIVGCEDKEIGELVIGLYSEITSEKCSLVSSMEVAEASKMVENVQRDIDIAFVNELATVLPRMGVDVDEVLEAADTKWSFHRHYPGIGVGGHCIPVDPYYYLEASNNSGAPSRLVPIARKINEEMPVISASSILNSIEGGAEKKRALVLGYSYKPNIGDTRMTPVQKLAEKLNDEGMEVLVWDPHVESENIPSWIHHVEDPMGVFELEVVILATAHNECINLDWEKLLLNTPTRKIFDGRRAMKASEMESLGWRYSGVGFP